MRRKKNRPFVHTGLKMPLWTGFGPFLYLLQKLRGAMEAKSAVDEMVTQSLHFTIRKCVFFLAPCSSSVLGVGPIDFSGGGAGGGGGGELGYLG